MQFAVPQFTEVEDRLIARLTLKQFLVLLATGGVVLFFWSVLGPNLIFFILSVPIVIVGLASALGKYNGRPMFTYLVPFAGFMASTRMMVFKREVAEISVSKSELKKDAEVQTAPADLEPAESRLKKLAYLLDRKTQEEGEIITHDNSEFLSTPKQPSISLPKLELSKVIDRTREQIKATARKLDGESAPKASKTFTPITAEPVSIPQVKKTLSKPEYYPSAEETLDFTKTEEEPESSALPATKFSVSKRIKKQPKIKKPKKLDPSSFMN